MQRLNVLVAVLAAGSLAVWAGTSLAADMTSNTTSNNGTMSKSTSTMSSTASKRMGARGEVTAVDPNAKTLTLKERGKQAKTVDFSVADNAKIYQGKSEKSLNDVKVGDRVRVSYDRTSDNKLEANAIRILRSGHMANKSTTTNKSS